MSSQRGPLLDLIEHHVDKGELLLTDLHDEQLQRLGPHARPDHQDIP